MSAYTLPHVTPLTSCWRNSLMRGDGPRASHPRPVRPSSRQGLIVVLNTFLPPLISSTTSGFEALRFASSVIVPVTPAYSFVAAIASRSFCVAAFRSGVPALDEPTSEHLAGLGPPPPRAGAPAGQAGRVGGGGAPPPAVAGAPRTPPAGGHAPATLKALGSS